LKGVKLPAWAATRPCEPSKTRPVQVLDEHVQLIDYNGNVPNELTLRLERNEALELLAVVQATLNAIARSQELTVGAAILTGIKSKLIDVLEAG
jgi:hypothetical protein